MGFEIKDLYTKSAGELFEEWFSAEGLCQVSVQLCEYISKVGMKEIFETPLGTLIATLPLEEYKKLYRRVVHYTVDVSAPETMIQKDNYFRAPALWDILQTCRRMWDFEAFVKELPEVSEVLKGLSPEEMYAYSFCTSVSNCTDVYGSNTSITDEYVVYLFDSYYFNDSETLEILKEQSLKYMEAVMRKESASQEDIDRMLEDVDGKLKERGVTSPIFPRMYKLGGSDLLHRLLESFSRGAEKRNDEFDEFFTDGEEQSENGAEEEEEAIPTDEKGNTLQ